MTGTAEKRFWNLANSLTMFRIISIPFVLWILGNRNPKDEFLAAILLAVAFLTDLLDGFFARKNREVTDLGKLLDPLADKLLISAVLIMLIPLGRVPAWLVFLLLAREMAVTGLRGIASTRGLVMGASFWGKLKTSLQMAAILAFLLPYSLGPISFQSLGTLLIWSALIVSLASGADYFYRYTRPA